MTPVYQSISDSKLGDCMRCAVASMLDLQRDQVPHFLMYGDYWTHALSHFLSMVGLEYGGTGRIATHSPYKYSFHGMLLATVPSLNYEGKTHIVIMNNSGHVIHDPTNQKSYLGQDIIYTGALKFWYILTKVDREPATLGSIPLKLKDLDMIN